MGQEILFRNMHKIKDENNDYRHDNRSTDGHTLPARPEHRRTRRPDRKTTSTIVPADTASKLSRKKKIERTRC